MLNYYKYEELVANWLTGKKKTLIQNIDHFFSIWELSAFSSTVVGAVPLSCCRLV